MRIFLFPSVPFYIYSVPIFRNVSQNPFERVFPPSISEINADLRATLLVQQGGINSGVELELWGSTPGAIKASEGSQSSSFFPTRAKNIEWSREKPIPKRFSGCQRLGDFQSWVWELGTDPTPGFSFNC